MTKIFRKCRIFLPLTILISLLTFSALQTLRGHDGYELIWQDEFDGDTINSNYWTFLTGTGCPELCGWGNNELQYYRKENAWVRDGILTIEARRENSGESKYTSARMKTQGKVSVRYGRFDIRARLPEGQGIWPALWMLGENITTISWPRCGEIDIMEMIGGQGRESVVHGTLHWHDSKHVYEGGMFKLESGRFADDFNIFSLIWDENSIRWLVNDIPYYEKSITGNEMSAFHEEFYFLFNLAVGGNWPGCPDDTTLFPQQMKVDYIRVYSKIQDDCVAVKW